MKFGKLSNISAVDFSLPAEPKHNADFLQKLPVKEAKTRLYIGCTGWSMKEWIGTVYPKGTKTKDYLHHYSRQFNAIEFNTTHYRTPNAATVQKWYAESAADFRFCPKVLQAISHSRDLGYGSSRITEFCHAIAGLEEKLGCCFMQVPPYFGIDRLPVLEQFFEKWPNEIELAIEVRHESWFASEANFLTLVELCEKYRKPLVITDVAGRRDVLHLGLTTSTTMIRFVGNGLVPSDYQRMDAWLPLLKKWGQNGISDIYFFPHQPDNVLAPEMCLYLYEKLREEETIEVRGPNLKKEEVNTQMSLF